MAKADVVVIGSGAAGLTAALAAAIRGASVQILEKSHLLGGTAAMSGGVLWMPNNHLMAAAGVPDSREQALEYVRRMTLGRVADELLETYLDECNATLLFLEASAGIRFERTALPDYQPELPGGSSYGRGVLGAPFDLSRLGDYAAVLRWAPETRRLDLDVVPDNASVGTREIAVNGQALVAHLLEACLRHGVSVRREAPVTDLVYDGRRVDGVLATIDGVKARVEARQGVVMASGGFEWNSALVNSFLGVPLELPLSCPANTGDGLLMLMRIGAALGNMTEAWWSPAVYVPGEAFDGSPLNRAVSHGRNKPGQIIVNRCGRRFAAEGLNYNDITKAMMVFDSARFEYGNLPCWLICDAEYFRVYPIVPNAEDSLPDWLATASTLRKLAEQVGIDADGLEHQVADFNVHAAAGVDPVFHRGESAYDRFRGESGQALNPNLRPLGAGPYYAFELRIGALGTKGGAVTDTRGRVLDADGRPIAGLFAAGNVSASVFGPSYPGPGATLGPATTFGRLAAETILGDAPQFVASAASAWSRS